MDEPLRQVRIILAPLLVFGSLLLGAYCDGTVSFDTFLDLETPTLTAIGGIVAASTIPLGFVIGGISILVLRFIFRVQRKERYDASLPQDAFDRIWSVVQSNAAQSRDNKLYCVVTFELEQLSEEMIGWLDRRWNAFNTYVNACVALPIALFVGWALAVQIGTLWLITTGVLIGVFWWLAYLTWTETKDMMNFQTQRIRDGRMPRSSGGTSSHRPPYATRSRKQQSVQR